MRVSTGMIYDSGLASMQDRMSSLLRVQQQLSTGRRILAPSDDPVAAARALEVTQSLAANAAQAETRNNAKSAIGIADAQLQSATDLLARVRELTVQAGDAALSAPDRQSIALELRQRFDELIAIANAKDGLGNSLFGGFQVGNKPFAGSIEDGVRYLGDDSVRALQVSGSRQMGISQSGNDIFMGVPNGNGVFATATQNTQSVNATHITYEGLAAALTNPPATTGGFEIRFWTDTAGGNAPRPAQAISDATIDLSALVPVTFDSVVAQDSQFQVVIDGNTANIDLDTLVGGTTYANATEIVAEIQTQLTAQSVAGTVNLDTTGRLVITSASAGLPVSTVAIADTSPLGDPVAVLFGTPQITPASNGAANTTYYDFVNSGGDSLFTGTASTTGGTGNTYTRAYNSGTPFSLSSVGPVAFDYGATVVFTGIPGDGDSFAVSRTTTGISIAAENITGNAARAIIDAGTVSDPLKWNQAANSGDLEVRFWVDVEGTVSTSGQAVASLATALPLVVTGGSEPTFNIRIDGGIIQTATVAAGNYLTSEDVRVAVQSAIDTAIPAYHGTATVSFDANGRLVVTSDAAGAGSTIALSEGNGGLARMFGVPAATTGTGATAGQAAGGVDLTTLLAPTFDVVLGANDTFTVNVDGAGVRTVVLSPGSYATAEDIRSEIQQQLDALVLPPVAASVNLDPGNRLIITSDLTGSGSSVVLGAGPTDVFASLFGTSTETAGSPAPAGRTFYDLVDATTGRSLFSGTDSATGGIGNTYTRPYVSGSDINLYGAGGAGQQTFDFGGSFKVSGIPAGGDAFTIKASADYTGNGYFVTEAKSATAYNTGSGIIGVGEILDAAKWNHPANSRNLEVRFWQDPDDPNITYYDLVDAETEKSLFTDGTSTAGGSGNTYTRVFSPGNAIDFSGLAVPYGADTINDFGISVTINGNPASGDAFKVRASESQSVFETLAKTVKLLESGKPIETMGNVQLSNELGAILTSLSRAEDSILTARAVFGSNLSEVDSLDSVGENLNIQYEETLSRLQDLDYAEAITKLMRQQMELQAAQQSFGKISQLSLFDYIR